MDWQAAAPWVMVGIVITGQIAHVAVGQWRIGALDAWRETVDEFIAESREARGRQDAQLEEHAKQINRAEARLDALTDRRSR